MTTLVLLILAGLVVAWVARQAGVTDIRDETDRYARLQHLGAGWSGQRSGSRSDNDLVASNQDTSEAASRAV